MAKKGSRVMTVEISSERDMVRVSPSNRAVCLDDVVVDRVELRVIPFKVGQVAFLLGDVVV